MSSNVNMSLSSEMSRDSSSLNIRSIEKYVLYGIGISGITINILIMIYLLLITSYKMKSSCFFFHHCLICLILSILCIPYSLSLDNHSIKCEYLANIQVTCVTCQLLNISAMVASEAYRFEDLIHSETNNKRQPTQTTTYFDNEIKNEKKQSKSTISCGCLSFGIITIWFSSVILHLGITMIGSEKKSYYEFNEKYCYFIIRDIRGYVLTLMWIIITIFSLIITIRYIRKILAEVSKARRLNEPLLSLAIIGQSHGKSIANKDLLMQQIQCRIQLNILLIVLFIVFWFPLFVVTLVDIKFQINDLIVRYLFLFAWLNSSISALTYLFFFDQFSFSFRRKRLTTYDSLTSYYNRIGDRFHDIGKAEQIIKDTTNSPTSNLNSNSIFVKELSSNERDDCSSLSSCTNITKATFQNGLLVTNPKH